MNIHDDKDPTHLEPLAGEFFFPFNFFYFTNICCIAITPPSSYPTTATAGSETHQLRLEQW
jgi:hypothetical protein